MTRALNSPDMNFIPTRPTAQRPDRPEVDGRRRNGSCETGMTNLGRHLLLPERTNEGNGLEALNASSP